MPLERGASYHLCFDHGGVIGEPFWNNLYDFAPFWTVTVVRSPVLLTLFIYQMRKLVGQACPQNCLTKKMRMRYALRPYGRA